MDKEAVTQTQCQYEYHITPQRKCTHPPLAGDNFCIFHSQNNLKDKIAFWDGIQKKLQDKDFDFEGYYFPLGLVADFGGIEFTDANFRRAIFKDTAVFYKATFSGEGCADFLMAKFSGERGADFFMARFSGKGGTDFSSATFSGKGSADFFLATFSGEGSAVFNGATFSGENCANFSFTDFSECNKVSFENTRFKAECKFLYTRFPWKSDHLVIFRGTRDPIDLSKCSFLYSNAERLVFRNFKFLENHPEELFNRKFPLWRRDFVLSDEKMVDKGKTVTITKEAFQPNAFQQDAFQGIVTTTEEEIKVDYSHVESLYRQFKKNLEEERNWEDAGEFHYGEMECKRKGLTWFWRNFGLLAWYRYLSGYGERPLRALCGLAFFIFLFAVFYCWLDAPPRQDFWDYYLWNLSIKAAFLQRIGDTGNEPVGFFGKLIYLLESVLCPTLIAMFILALRRRLKR